MVNKFKQFEYISGPNGVGQVQIITGSNYQIFWLQLRNNSNIVDPRLKKMSKNYPLETSSNPVNIIEQSKIKTQNLVQWQTIGDIDANYSSLGFEFETIRKQYLNGKGYLNE